MSEKSWFNDLFINEAKAALDAHPSANWNQNDPTEPDYVKGRTHYDDFVVVSEVYNANELPNVGYKGSDRRMHYHDDAFVEVRYANGDVYIGYADDLDSKVIKNVNDGSTLTIRPIVDSTTSLYKIKVTTVSAPVYMAYKRIIPKALDEKYIPDTIQRVGGDVIIPSSTADSTKKFRLTVDDSGTITATEVTDS